MSVDSDDDAHQRSAMHRTFQILRTMAEQQHQGVRVTYLAKTLGMTPATTHRLLQGLTQEGKVEQDQQNKLYRLSLDLFCLAAQAGAVNDLRSVARPALLRLNASLGDTETEDLPRLAKPFRQEELAAAVAGLLDRRRS